MDKVLSASSTQTESKASIPVISELDRVYKNIPQDTTSIVEDGKPRFDVVRDSLSDTVVWNPWKEKAAGMSDFAPQDGYLRMVCVEVGSVAEWQRLEPGETFEGGQVVKSYV